MSSVPTDGSYPMVVPPFRGHIETTYDALLILEAARRGMVPRITRRLTERERPMIQSGAVFIFDEQESGIKRWTDSLFWSPSRILGNFLVYRETDKRGKSRRSPNSTSPTQTSENAQLSMDMQYTSPPHLGMELPQDGGLLGTGALQHTNVQETMDRNRERQLVGSLTSSNAFKPGGLVKKTISVDLGGYCQHLISYYTIEDVLGGKLRAPSSLPEFASLEVNEILLRKTHFRFPPQIEVLPNGGLRYKGEHIPSSSPNKISPPLFNEEGLGLTPMQHLRLDSASHSAEPLPPSRGGGGSLPMTIPIPSGSSSSSYYTPDSVNDGASFMSDAGLRFVDDPMFATPDSATSAPPHWGQMSPASHTIGSGMRSARPPSSSRSSRFDPYAATSPRPHSATLNQRRRDSVPYEAQTPYQDIKPVQAANGTFYQPEYTYPPASAHGYSPAHDVTQTPNTPYSTWQQPPMRPTGMSGMPRHPSGYTPPANNEMPLYPASLGSTSGRPSTGQQGYQAPPPHQWNGHPAYYIPPNTSHATPHSAQAPLPSGGQNAYQAPPAPQSGPGSGPAY